MVNGDGSIVQGTGFTVTHSSAGEYQVSFPAGTLTGGLCPPVVTAVVFAGVVRSPQLSGRACTGGGAGNFTLKTLDTPASRTTPRSSSSRCRYGSAWVRTMDQRSMAKSQDRD